MNAAVCPDCGSSYFRGLDRVDVESGHRAEMPDNEPQVFQCSNCNNMITFKEGVAVPFKESRRPRPTSMQEPASMKPAGEGGPVG